MSPLSVEQQAVVNATAPVDENSQQFIKEWVRFWFHGLAISLCGILAIIMPDWAALSLLLPVVAWFAWYEIVRTSPKLQDWLSSWLLWPLTSWMVWACKKIKIRPHEVGTRASALDFLLGFTIAWAVCPSYLLATACFVTAWCDPFARVFGRRFGKTKWFFSEKTPIGSMTCMVVAAVVACTSLCFFGSGRIIELSDGLLTVKWINFSEIMLVSLAVGFIAAMVELIPQFPKHPKPGDIMSPADNFSIILTVSLVLTLWHHALSQTPPLI